MSSHSTSYRSCTLQSIFLCMGRVLSPCATLTTFTPLGFSCSDMVSREDESVTLALLCSVKEKWLRALSLAFADEVTSLLLLLWTLRKLRCQDMLARRSPSNRPTVAKHFLSSSRKMDRAGISRFEKLNLPHECKVPLSRTPES